MIFKIKNQKTQFTYLGCVCFGFKPLPEMLFRKSGYLVVTKNVFSVDRKTRAMGRKIFSVVIFTSNHFWRHAKKERTHRRTDAQTQRERERELEHKHTHKTQITPPLSQAPITLAHCPDHVPAKHPRPTNTGPPRSQPTPPSSPIHLFDRQPCTDELRSILTTDCRSCSTRLSNALAATINRRSGRHQPPAHYTPPLNPLDLTAAASIHSDSLFPSISCSFFPLSLSL